MIYRYHSVPAANLQRLFLFRRLCRIFCSAELCSDLCQTFDVFRRRSAASTDQFNSQLQEIFHLLHKLITGDIICSRCRIRQACIRFDHQRQIRQAPQLFCHRENFHRSQRAVDPHGIHAETFQGQHHCFQANACKCPAVFFKCHRHYHRQIACFLCSKHRSLHLIQIRHGFDNDQVCQVAASLYHLAECIVCIFKRQRSHRLKKFSQRAQIDGDSNFSALRRHDFLRLNSCLYLNPHRFLQSTFTDFLLFEPIGSKGAGINDIRSCFYIFFMDLRQDLRMCKSKFSRRFFRTHARTLQHGPHPSI